MHMQTVRKIIIRALNRFPPFCGNGTLATFRIWEFAKIRGRNIDRKYSASYYEDIYKKDTSVYRNSHVLLIGISSTPVLYEPQKPVKEP